MNHLRRMPSSSSPPDGIAVEKPATNLASLVAGEEFSSVVGQVLRQWGQAETFRRLAKHGIRPVDRMLFYGPPGNGKTMAAQYLASQLEVPLYRMRTETLINAFLGATAANVAGVMSWLERAGRCVILVDEAEQLFYGRASSDGSAASRALTDAQAVWWQRLDRWEAETIFILATNLPEQLDPALVSRIDLKLEFPPPTAEQAAEVVEYWAEVLSEYGGQAWQADLIARGHSPGYESFREVFQSVQQAVRVFVAQSPED